MIELNASLRLRWLWQGVGLILIVLVIYLSLTPYPLEIPVPQGDKYGHVAAYATLMLWHCQIHSDTRFRVGWAITFIALGIGLEFMQRLTGYRTFEIDDMMADGAGVLLGWIAAPPRLPNLLRSMEARWPDRPPRG